MNQITINANGKEMEMEKNATLADLLVQLNMKPMGIAAELNGTLVSSTDFGDTMLQNGDELLLVKMVGGG